jgi:hypothetical protein
MNQKFREIYIYRQTSSCRCGTRRQVWRQRSADLPGGAKFLLLWGTAAGTLASWSTTSGGIALCPTAAGSWCRGVWRQRHPI